ncbi:lipoprotein-releasing system transmembrane subunit LolC [Alkalilimnicola ehrlichii]|uniref:Lipoprotein-releasing system transmembrane subunit LolC n=1 Tax=Alkalilimnicola ehrlichii TaxID=351052 RepID=A0A3E0WP08_9GAMM|nr:lipoprotein-releasing ABC transporter permease subunit [Alkalilimnicola ehrlichii]RFA24557.1 lipoprotein-releasing system transmembrane subunit LolC [Alkalilimnicola ehrlichii]RFA33777.1 lipoprotein-releasing system transmembrane subunit LolC [Alkalilimnicola ehrlichii]
MFKPIELFIGLRYTRAKRRNHFVSFISLTSMVGIALGVTALITVLSVMNGFETQLRERILGMVAHATVSERGAAISDWQSVLDQARQHPRVEGAAPFVNGEVMLTRGGNVSAAMVRGILPEHEGEVSDVVDHFVVGDIDRLVPGEYGIVLGSELASLLRVRVGDQVTVVSPEARMNVVGITPRVRRFTVEGIFNVGMYEYDRGIALVHMEDAARLFRTGDGVTGIRLKFDDLMAAPWLARELAADLPGTYSVRDWTVQHYNFFQAVRTEKTVMFVILTLIVAVAAFNIVSTLVMVVTDKQADIAILRTLGLSPGSVMGVFIVQGAVIGVVGTLLGVAGGISLALNVDTLVPAIERLMGIQFLPADVYHISELPSELRWNDVTRITGVALVLSLVATLYPAWRASRTAPAEALRYE